MTGSLRGLSRCLHTCLATPGLGPRSAPCCPADGCSLTEAWSVVQLAAVQQTVHCRYTCTLYTVQLYARCYCFQDLLEAGGPQRRGAHLGRKMEVERYQIQDNCNVGGFVQYKHMIV